MRKLLFLLPGVLFASFLSDIKQEEIKVDKDIALKEAKKLRDSWINPVNIKYLYQKGNQFPNQKFKSFTISIDQPIFKSGGIYEAIRYADSKKTESLIGVKLKKSELIALAIKSAYELKKINLQIKRQKLLIKNAKINLKIKEDAYISGELDSTFLDSAIIDKNSKEIVLLSLKQQFEDIYKTYKNLVKKDFKLPKFRLIKKESFIKENLKIKQLKSSKSALKELKKMTLSKYLPSISVFANYNYQYSQGSQFIPDFKYKAYFNTYGFRFSMPLFDINSFKEVEIAKLKYLKSNLLLQDSLKEESLFYDAILKKIELTDKKISLTKKDISLYKRLLSSTKEQFRAGEKTSLDVETMQNSLDAKFIDLEIFEIDKQLLLLDMYKKMELK